MNRLSSYEYIKSIASAVTFTLMILSVITMITACSPKPSAQQHATEEKAKAGKSSPEPASTNNVICKNCGVVLSVNEIETEGTGSGLGVVAGGVVGGLLGNQVGNGTGRDLATIAGAVGGAYAGNKIEKNSKKTKSYDVKVRIDSGEEHIVHQTNAPNVVKGERVIIENEVIVKN